MALVGVGWMNNSDLLCPGLRFVLMHEFGNFLQLMVIEFMGGSPFT